MGADVYAVAIGRCFVRGDVDKRFVQFTWKVSDAMLYAKADAERIAKLDGLRTARLLDEAEYGAMLMEEMS
jgi:hypothetical protein